MSYLFGLGATSLVLHGARRRLRQGRYVLAAICIVIGVGCAWFTIQINSKPADAAFSPSDPANSPMGVAKGIFPGRVAWIHDPNATNWDGSSNYYWYDIYNDQTVIDRMFSEVLRALTNEPTDYAAWDALFRDFNNTHHEKDIGYQPGEKITIKPNHVNQRIHDWQRNWVDVAPQVMLGLLRQLVNKAGVNQADITISDPSRYIANKIFDKCHAEFPNVVYEETDFYTDYGDDRGTDPNRVMSVSSAEPLVFYSDTSSSSIPDHYQDKLPMSYVNADYVINLAVFKGHYNPGVTLSGKNWYGCFGGRNPQSVTHNTLPNANPNMGQYRAQVDLMGHEHLGGKTFLYLFDGLWSAPTHWADPKTWQKVSPLIGDYSSSLFASQDPVAIDSVGLDFLYNEWADSWNSVTDAVDDYLHEAALADDPCSGTFYDPHRPIGDPDATRLESLGVHEHWNNATDKQYSRNLGPGDGIELVTEAELDCSGEIDGDVNGDCEVNLEDLDIIAEYWLLNEDDLRFGDVYDDGQIDLRDFAAMSDAWCECNVVPSSNCTCP